MTPLRHTTSVLTIAGSDSGGAAGIQADLRTIAAHGLHGLSVITAVTAQNMRGVEAVHRVPARDVAAQLHAVFAGFRIDAIKTGMLGGSGSVAAIAGAVRARPGIALVIDPVLVSTSGAPLLSAAALRLARRELFPLATLLTPNVPEAETLLGGRIGSDGDLVEAARELLAGGARAVLLKGGHLRGRTVRDVLVAGAGVRRFEHERLPFEARGTGCALATAIACGLARGQRLDEAVRRAEAFLQRALRRSRPAGRGTRRVLGIVQN